MILSGLGRWKASKCADSKGNVNMNSSTGVTARNLAAVCVVVTFAVFVWPTRYAHYVRGTGNTPRLRRDRVTGNVEWLDLNSGWRDPATPPRSTTSVPLESLPPTEIAKLLVEDLPVVKRPVWIADGERLVLRIYNSTSWNLHEITLRVTISKSVVPKSEEEKKTSDTPMTFNEALQVARDRSRHPKGADIERTYRFRRELGTEPGAYGTWEVDADVAPIQGEGVAWTVTGARGTSAK